MSRRVDVEVGRNGQLKIEFSGFDGELCYEEAESLQKILRSMGLWALPVSVMPKTSSEMEAEVGAQKETRRKVSVS
ncbi:MAG: hypothetical protein ACOX5Q_04320 [Bacillota bacterium]|jgi:hypothetical protein|nr:hypothetical protein [Candidatus Fermentithermobacillaceae bacterium]